MPTIRVGAPSIGMTRPTTDSSPPNADCQTSLERMATSSAPGSVSARVNSRPRSGCDAEHRHQLRGDERRIDAARLIRRAQVDGAGPIAADLLERAVPLAELDELRHRDPELVEAQRRELAGDEEQPRPDAGYGSGLSRTPLMTLKIALLAPMPSASVRMVTAA